ncbi:multicopper oxidase family protein [Thalassospira tepidiphila]|uniref:multicopper oxidase family protein n=1 Tax=Thalassospira tepidiphila TaxID=393657 RepID=UPI003AA97915
MITRRGLLKGSAAATVAAGIAPMPWLVSPSNAMETIASQSPIGITDDLPNPMEIHSVDGRLKADFFMDASDYSLPSGPAKLRIFNASIPGPTIRMKPGDTLELAFENRMPPNKDAGEDVVTNVPNRFNTTNVHYHGFHVSPRGNSDNVYLQIEPGQSFNYVVKLPVDHPAGNYWYHPHRHGSVSAQVASGAAGMAIIGGTLDDVPEIAEALERVLVLQAPIPGIDGLLESEKPIWPLDAERDFLVNGQYRPKIYIREGEVQHWRLLNAGDAQFIPLRADGMEMHLIGLDGNPLPKAEETEEFLLAPGNRANLLIKGVKTGTYALRRPAFMQGKASLPEEHLADIIVIAADDPRVGKDVKFGKSIPTGDLPKNEILTDITDDEVTNRRKFVLGVKDVSGFFDDTEFTINGQGFDPRRDDVVAKLGAVEEWTLINTTPFPHPLHIHVNPFQVVSINGEPDERKPWMDTIAVPAAGTVTFRTRFVDFTGRYVMHCHILPHEDTGMMINVNIEV